MALQPTPNPPKTRRPVSLVAFLAALALLAACGDDSSSDSAASADGATGATTAAVAVDDAESPYCRTALDYAASGLTPVDDSDPVAFEAYVGAYVEFVETAAAQAPAELADAWALNAEAITTQFAPLFERYGYDVARIEAEATPEEQALLNEPPPDIAEAQASILEYESLVCGAGQPPAAEDEEFSGPADSPYCEASNGVDAAMGEVVAAGVQPEDFEALLTSGDIDAFLATQDETAPEEIAEDVVVVNDFTRDELIPLMEAYDYDARAILLEGSAAERLVFQSADPAVLDEFTRVEAYDEQVCGGAGS